MDGRIFLKGIVLVVAFLTSASAWAIDRAYLGDWTPKPGKCDFSGFGPFRITANGLEEHETSCRTKRARRDAQGWAVQLSCANEGSDTLVNLHWQILPNGRLKEISKGKISENYRCTNTR